MGKSVLITTADSIAEMVSVKGGAAWLVGGSVRDLMLGRESCDIDLAVSGSPGELARELASSMGGSAFVMDKVRDVHRVVASGLGVQIDLSPLKGRIEEDLAERDFTVNAMALPVDNVQAGVGGIYPQLVDPHGGLDDLKKKTIRAVGPGVFASDPLRMLRAYRLAAELGFDIDAETGDMVSSDAAHISEVSAERIRDELYLILSGDEAAGVFGSMRSSGLLKHVIPEVGQMEGVAQSEPHVHDLLAHSLRAMEYAGDIMGSLDDVFGEHASEVRLYLEGPADGILAMRGLVKLCALLHDTGKPSTYKYDGDRVRFHGHGKAGGIVNTGIAARLKMSAAAADVLARTALYHMRPLHLSDIRRTRRAIHRLVRDAGQDLPALLIVALADARATRDIPDVPATDVEGVVRELADYCYGEYRAAVSQPLVRGGELMAELGIGPGPAVGRLLQEIEEARAEGVVNDRVAAIEYARNVLESGELQEG